ncbi:hypothetical protein SEA_PHRAPPUCCINO_104 [Mycobacterium phage Phrappuccino]|uniref:Uncharacterized protein n=1 Tax=Mycobacterium phage Phrappuccino TaxID=2591223 RepID=A0A514DDT4_9CAUD|nr:hypothetical protein KHQ87_gp104 [Mycobacterium phage Phrappuccino]QDH91779.1 hypothetical protein SEA_PHRAPPUCCINO_104 [Mycobacterium phage Phrappuccino]QIQ63221.1 hypothetical protein SEA_SETTECANDELA_104 [Mycobacterium phage Settecandela]
MEEEIMTEVVDLPALMRDGGENAVLEALFASRSTDTSADTGKSTAAKRRAAQRKAIEEFDLDRLLDLQEKMSRVIDTLTKNELRLDEGGTLTPEQAESLMAEHLDEREIAELLEVRKEMIREAVYEHLDQTVGPNTSGALEVPTLGKKFCREGAGLGTPKVDEQRLQGVLGERWDEVCVEEVIPAQVIPERRERRFSLDRLLDLAQRDPQILEALGSCLAPGKLRTPRFVTRDM